MEKSKNGSIENKIKASISRKTIGANWQNIQNTIKNEKPATTADSSILPTQKSSINKKRYSKLKLNESECTISNCVAIDCEMVGTGLNGLGNMLARVSIVNENGQVIIDKYVKPREEVTDYRTRISGIRPKDIECGEDFSVVQKEVAQIIKHKLIVGHALKNDFDVLFLNHPKTLLRDTARYNHFKKNFCKSKTPSLKTLAKIILDEDIQNGEHDSIEDARTALKIYKKFKHQWERDVKNHRRKFD